jgi:cellulose synthase/poly-beta-1,6-N-acetylglucosamine synthase-like glycosyltransferase
MNAAGWILLGLAMPSVVLGAFLLVQYPMAIRFDRRERRRSRQVPDRSAWMVSVIVPAYNEGRVLDSCIRSILADSRPRLELVLVDDGSTDDTWVIMNRYADDPRVTIVGQRNGGKAAALNAGIARARGDVLVFVDADGIFTPGTIPELLTGFDRRDVGGVCGNDQPVNLDRPQTHLLALLTHSTAFVRRALALVNCLPIVSGNVGAFRREVINEVDGFVEGFIGEDLELTWRVHRAGYRINFRPRALVYAEVPSTPKGLWRQRVRWTRGLIQTLRLHHDMLFTSRYGLLGWYLPINIVMMLVLPVLQLAALALVLATLAAAASPLALAFVGGFSAAGIAVTLLEVLFAVGLNRAWHDLRYLYVLPLVPLFSVLMSLVTVSALVLEIRRAPAHWNKLARTGVVSRTV